LASLVVITIYFNFIRFDNFNVIIRALKSLKLFTSLYFCWNVRKSGKILWRISL